MTTRNLYWPAGNWLREMMADWEKSKKKRAYETCHRLLFLSCNRIATTPGYKFRSTKLVVDVEEIY